MMAEDDDDDDDGIVWFCKCLGVKWNQTLHSSKSEQGCGTANPLICMRDLDSIPTPWQDTKPFPLQLQKTTGKTRSQIQRS